MLKMRWLIFVLLFVFVFATAPSALAWKWPWSSKSSSETAHPDPLQKIYETCNQDNDYYEEVWRNTNVKKRANATYCASCEVYRRQAALSLSLSLNLKAQVSNRCVVEQVRRARAHGVYTTCENDSGKHDHASKTNGRSEAQRQVDRPCLSKNYADFITTGFHAAAACFGVDETDWYKVLSHESSFQMNAVSPTGCVGVGQLSGILMRDVAESGAIERFSSRLTAPACDVFQPELLNEVVIAQRLAGFRQKRQQPPKEFLDQLTSQCARFAFQGFPWRNFVYSAVSFRKLRRNAELQLHDYRSLFATTADYDLAVTELVHAYYNGGVGAVNSAMNAAIFNNQLGRKKSDAATDAQYLEHQKSCPHLLVDRRSCAGLSDLLRLEYVRKPLQSSEFIWALREAIWKHFGGKPGKNKEVALYSKTLNEVTDYDSMGGSCFKIQ